MNKRIITRTTTRIITIISIILLTGYTDTLLPADTTNRACGQPGTLAQILQSLLTLESALDQPITSTTNPSCGSPGLLAQILTIASNIETNLEIEAGACSCENFLNIVSDFGEQLDLVTPGYIYDIYYNIFLYGYSLAAECYSTGLICSILNTLFAEINAAIFTNPLVTNFWSATDQAIANDFQNALLAFYNQDNCFCAP